MDLVSRVDDYQRRHRWAGLPVAVLYKFGDDQGTYLAAQITYYGFVAMFPLLLLLATILGYALHGNQHLQRDVLDSALAQFPVIGDQITANIRSFHGSTAGLVIGILGCVYGGLGIVQATQATLNKVWGVPRDSRPNPVGRNRHLRPVRARPWPARLDIPRCRHCSDLRGIQRGARRAAMAAQPASPVHQQRGAHPRRPARLHLLREDRTA
jgi:hypothetical protein